MALIFDGWMIDDQGQRGGRGEGMKGR